MSRVDFFDSDYEPVSELIYAIVTARYNNKWMFVRHHDRATPEITGGHIEPGEDPADTARRELAEETGAVEFTLDCVATYSVEEEGNARFGRLYYAEISRLDAISDTSEIAEVIFMDELPDNLTYPDIQPVLLQKVSEYLLKRGSY